MEGARGRNDRLKFTLLILTVFIVFFMSCGQVIGPGNEDAIRGMVINREGDPVSNVLINLTYYFKPLINEIQTTQNDYTPAITIIRYTVPEQQRVIIWITRYQESDTTVHLVDRIHQAGFHEVIWDGRNSKNQLEKSDLYNVHIAYPNRLVTNLLVLNNDYASYSVMDNLAYYSKTTQDGQFSILKSDLMHQKVDFELIWTDEQGNPVKVELLPYVKIWGLHQNYGNTFKDFVYVSPERGAEVLLQFDS